MTELQHSGVKGMRWGVRRRTDRPGGADGKPDAGDVKRGKIGRHLDSMKRERQWKSVLKELDKMTTKDINTIHKRISQENRLKDLSKSKVATKKDKEDYLRRHKMSDQELKRKVDRLQAKDTLHKAINNASKEQREFGEKVVQIASSVGVKYAFNRGNITGKDLFETAWDASKSPKESYENSRKEVLKTLPDDSKKKWLAEKALKEFEKKWQVKQDKK